MPTDEKTKLYNTLYNLRSFIRESGRGDNKEYFLVKMKSTGDDCVSDETIIQETDKVLKELAP